jgi:endonuclease YncB( thermonuclease family)
MWRTIMRLSPRISILILSLALVVPFAPTRAEIAGPPIIIDGDTIEVRGAAVRLYGIDAPELGQTCRIGRHAYDCGKIARTALLDLTAGVSVICKLVPPDPAAASDASDASDDSPNGRIGRCTADGYDLSEGMTYTGWALALRRVSGRYVAFEDGARAAGRGLWKGPFVTPWDWRAGVRLPRSVDAE